MNLTDLLILGLATWQAVEIWRHSSLFAIPRAYFQARSDLRLGQLLSCPWCLSVWVALVLVAWWMYSEPIEKHPVVYYAMIGLRAPILALAISRLANAANDLTWKLCRTPNRVDKTQ